MTRPLGSRGEIINLDVSLRDPDGAVWQTSRNVAASGFQPLPDDSLMVGRNGFTLLVPSRDWARPPRRGGLATVSMTAMPERRRAAGYESDTTAIPVGTLFTPVGWGGVEWTP